MSIGNSTTDIAIVGAGIVGASVAFHAARSGASVVLIDKSLPGTGVTSASFAWIGKPGAWNDVDSSTPLRRKALDDWHRLSNELSGVVVRWSGSIVWRDDLASGTAQLSDDERIIEATQIAEMEPSLRTPPRRALHNIADGAIDPIAVTEALVRGARDYGADIQVGVSAVVLEVDRDKVTGLKTSHGTVKAKTVVVAAGADVPFLLTPWGIELPIRPSPALLLRFVAPPELVRTLIWSNEVEARQTADGQLLVPVEYSGEASQADLVKTVEETIERLSATFDVKAEELHLVDVRVGMRPMPDDGMPLIGPVLTLRDVYVTVMHSGVTLAPVVGRLVADELINHVESEELKPLRPMRDRA